MEHTITIPARLGLEESVNFALAGRQLPPADHYVIDFRDLIFVEPFGMLLTAMAIRAIRQRHANSTFRASNFRQHTYEAHMGFFQSFGVDFGNQPGEASGNDNYLPITHLSINQVKEQSRDHAGSLGDALETQTHRLAQVLTREVSGDLVDVLAYSLRELFRNVVEHSQADSIHYCAQYWPGLSRVEIAILDTGCGVARSLACNPHLAVQSDAHALDLCVLPGVSGKAFKGARSHLTDTWCNSGYGLFMTSRLCGLGGSFFIASGNAGLVLEPAAKRRLHACVEGTALRMIMQTDHLAGLRIMLSQFRNEGRAIAQRIKGAILDPSSASSMLAWQAARG